MNKTDSDIEIRPRKKSYLYRCALLAVALWIVCAQVLILIFVGFKQETLFAIIGSLGLTLWVITIDENKMKWQWLIRTVAIIICLAGFAAFVFEFNDQHRDWAGIYYSNRFYDDLSGTAYQKEFYKELLAGKGKIDWQQDEQKWHSRNEKAKKDFETTTLWLFKTKTYIRYIFWPPLSLEKFYIVMSDGRFLEKKFCSFLPKFKALGQKYPNDVEIRLGLAYVYDLQHLPITPSSPPTPEQIYEKILVLDPNNRPALAFLTMRLCFDYIGKRKNAIEDLERRRELTKTVKLDNRWGDSFLEEHWFKDGDKGITIKIDTNQWIYHDEYGDHCTIEKGKGHPHTIITITDPDLAAGQLRENFDKRAPAVIETIEKNQNKDPDNALYNYLKARIYLALEKNDYALEEIEKGIAKKYLTDYQDSGRLAALRVLNEIDFPEPYKISLLSGRYLSDMELVSCIWRENLADLAKSYESQGNFESAEKIYNFYIEMAKQCENAPTFAERALKYLDEFHERTSQRKNK